MGRSWVGAPCPASAAFADPATNHALTADGYAVVDLLDEDDLAQVRDLRRRLGSAPGDPCTGFFSDAWCGDADYRRAVDRELGALLEGPLRRLAPGLSLLAVAHLAKWPSAGSSVSTHRDPSFVDEAASRSFTAWCALDATDGSNGVLLVAPGSHRGASVGWRVHDGPENLAPEVDGDPHRFLVEVPLVPGQAVVFDHALVHGSGPNTSGQVRVAIAALMVPDGAHASYALPAEPGFAEVFEVDRRFFVEHQFHELDPHRMRAELPPSRRARRAERTTVRPWR